MANNNTNIGKRATIQNIILTPAKARELLAINTEERQRYKRQAFVEFLAEEIRNDRWTITNDAITVLENGKLGNGQHRCGAVVEANLPVRVFLAENMPMESFANTDQGIKRSQYDNLGLQRELVFDVKLIAAKLGLMVGGRIPNQTILDIRAWYEPMFDTFRRVADKHFKAKGNNASTRIGFGLRWAIGRTHEQRKYTLEQYRAFITANPEQMSKCVGAAWRRTVLDKKEFHTQDRQGRFALLNFIFYIGALERRTREPLIRTPKLLDSEVTQWLRMCPDAFMAGPTQDRHEHPYVFTDQPTIERPVYGVAAENKARARRRRDDGDDLSATL